MYCLYCLIVVSPHSAKVVDSRQYCSAYQTVIRGSSSLPARMPAKPGSKSLLRSTLYITLTIPLDTIRYWQSQLEEAQTQYTSLSGKLNSTKTRFNQVERELADLRVRDHHFVASSLLIFRQTQEGAAQRKIRQLKSDKDRLQEELNDELPINVQSLHDRKKVRIGYFLLSALMSLYHTAHTGSRR